MIFLEIKKSVWMKWRKIQSTLTERKMIDKIFNRVFFKMASQVENSNKTVIYFVFFWRYLSDWKNEAFMGGFLSILSLGIFWEDNWILRLLIDCWTIRSFLNLLCRLSKICMNFYHTASINNYNRSNQSGFETCLKKIRIIIGSKTDHKLLP